MFYFSVFVMLVLLSFLLMCAIVGIEPTDDISEVKRKIREFRSRK